MFTHNFASKNYAKWLDKHFKLNIDNSKYMVPTQANRPNEDVKCNFLLASTYIRIWITRSPNLTSLWEIDRL